MISISKAAHCPDFSTLAGNPFDPHDLPHVVLSSVGKIIDAQIADLNRDEHFAIENYVIMPDHIHILWLVRSRLSFDLGYHVGLFKSRCTKLWHEQCGVVATEANPQPLFAPKFNDRLAYNQEVASRFDRYITDNPRRRLVAILYPQLFNRRQCVRIGDRVMDIYGNFHLLRHPIIAPVIVSSRYTPEQRRQCEVLWEETIRSGGVLVSPFISTAEKEILHRGIEEGASIIRILPSGIPPKYKPSGREFELCAEGRCLHIGSGRPSQRNEKLTRSEALELNALARWIAAHHEERMAILRSLGLA
jgi:hypothetical protein